MKHPALALMLLVALLLTGLPAAAFPGFVVAKDGAERTIPSSHIVLMRRGDRTVVTVMPEYRGPFDAFALVVAVPKDVTPEHLQTLRREFIDRVANVSAPRFHEFWEMDPCEPGKVEQEWERSLKASESTNFLGGPPMAGPKKKVAKELLLTVVTDFKVQGEYTFTVVDSEQTTTAKWLKEHGYQLPAKAEAALEQYSGEWGFVVAEVDPNKIELIGGDSAVLSPIRFWTESPYDEVPSRLGLLSASGPQELVVLAFDESQRVVTRNYPFIFPPTNIEVAFKVKERMGEFYAALHDRLMTKHPGAFLAEYAWAADDCGEPCPSEAIRINELLTLGADVFEEAVPEEERNPEPPQLSDEEKKKEEAELKALKPKERRELKEERQEEREEIARRKALVGRNHYVLSRLHARYDSSSLPKEIQLGFESQAVRGGVGIPKGPDAKLELEVVDSRDNRHQTRYVNFHPWKGVLKCEQPDRWRWGKAPRTYRGLRKIWVTEDMARKDRKQIKLEEVVETPIAELGLEGNVSEKLADAGADADADAGPPVEAEAPESPCGCRTVGQSGPSGGAWSLLGLAFAGWLSRRRGLRSRRAT